MPVLMRAAMLASRLLLFAGRGADAFRHGNSLRFEFFRGPQPWGVTADLFWNYSGTAAKASRKRLPVSGATIWI